MELNNFDKSLREFVFKYAPMPMAKCGEIVTTKWGDWKRPHKVKIYEVGVEIINLNLTIGERKRLGLEGWLGLELYYYADRVNDKGEPTGVTGAVLTNFTTDSGKQWQKIGQSFNNCGLSFQLAEISKYSSEC